MLRGPPFIRRFIAMCASGDLLSSWAQGVGHSPEAFCENSLAVGVDFAEGDGSETGPAGGPGEASDPAEEIQVSWSWFIVHVSLIF